MILKKLHYNIKPFIDRVKGSESVINIRGYELLHSTITESGLYRPDFPYSSTLEHPLYLSSVRLSLLIKLNLKPF